MPNLDRGDSLFAALDALQEVAVVVPALVQMYLVRGDHLIENTFRIGLKLAAIDVYPALVAVPLRSLWDLLIVRNRYDNPVIVLAREFIRRRSINSREIGRAHV